jgi:formylglycine-generating enzyme required for sulfatase activity
MESGEEQVRRKGRSREQPRPASRCLRLASCALLPAILIAAPPVVSEVSFSQRANSNLVDITYDLADADGDNEFTVTFDVSTDGGSTWPIKPERWSGAAGSGVKSGKSRQITWDALGDCGRLRSDNVVVRVKADDGRMAKARPTPDAVRPVPDAGRKEQGAPAGMTFLRTNSQGYEEYRWEKDGSTVIKIPAGTFTMGSSDGDADEKPVHQVELGEYYIDKYEVTNRQYKQFCDATGRSYPEDPSYFTSMSGYFRNYPDYPVVNVSWNDAAAYCTWAGKRLPTEAEWEKAARGTDSRKYPWGNGEPDAGGFYRANWGEGSDRSVWKRDGYEYSSPVGSYERGASPCGCLDMAGNVWEWCSDWYDGSYYGRSPRSNPNGPSSGSYRVSRGGSWDNGAWYLRCSDRVGDEPSYRGVVLGFRCAGGR